MIGLDGTPSFGSLLTSLQQLDERRPLCGQAEIIMSPSPSGDTGLEGYEKRGRAQDKGQRRIFRDL
eukprot:3140610-Alexandrium_andersonii.AAC.1